MKKTEFGLTPFQGELADRLEAYLKRENPDIKHFGTLRRAVILKALNRASGLVIMKPAVGEATSLSSER